MDSGLRVASVRVLGDTREIRPGPFGPAIEKAAFGRLSFCPNGSINSNKIAL
jgi:hypothetical protein